MLRNPALTSAALSIRHAAVHATALPRPSCPTLLDETGAHARHAAMQLMPLHVANALRVRRDRAVGKAADRNPPQRVG